ncbi:hypothetical protein HYT00_00775 [Candidatus Giovannonibacteria bacterium]|nr:hypothetical protein [Candidatus Giovannonibacteria bacterium]
MDKKNLKKEEEARKLSKELAEKLKKDEISLMEMAEAIDKFLTEESGV